MSMNTGNFGELLDPGMRAHYGLSYKQREEQYSKVFDIKDSTKNFEETLSLAGLGLVPEKTQGGSVSYDDMIQGYKHRLTHVTYGLGFIVTREMYEDDLYKQINAFPEALARSVRHTIETIAANILNRAFNSSYTGADGKELCATDHPLVAGGTFANEPSTPADLSITSFEQALIDIGDFVDDRGLDVAAQPKKLIVTPSFDFTAQKILGSEKDPASNYNAVNPARGVMPYTVMNFLTDPDAWFITTDMPNSIVFYWRRRPDFTKDNDFDSENAKWKTVFRCIAGWDDPRGIYGSPGV